MRRAIALMITLLFIILITLSIGIGLKQINVASEHVKGEKFLYQSSVILDDVMIILNNSKELQDINSSEKLNMFLSLSSIIPFEAEGINVIIEVSSARSKFNVNNLVNANNTQNKDRIDSLKQYFSNNMVITAYVDIMLDAMSEIKENIPYNSDVFNKKPYLFRDYITSKKHLKEFNNYYESYYHDDSLKNIDFEELFYYSNDKDYKIDLSFATQQVWEMMLGCDKQRAIDLSSSFYETEDEIDLSDEEKKLLNRFEKSVFQGFLDISLNIKQDKHSAKIRFEYDIKNKKGSNFVYEI